MTKSIKKSKKAVFPASNIKELRKQFLYAAEIIDARLEHYCCRALNSRFATELPGDRPVQPDVQAQAAT